MIWRSSGAAAATLGGVRKEPAEEQGLERPLCWLPPSVGGTTIEITTRTQQGRFLLVPSTECREIIEGVLGRAQSLFPSVQLHAYWFLSNHYNLLLTVPNSFAMAEFMKHVNSNLARELGRLHGWREGIWGRRYRWIPIVDAAKEEARLVYLLAQGTKENLVARPADWPGANCLEALLEGTDAIGVWFDRTREYRTRKRKKKPTKYEFATRYRVTLAPLPSWGPLSEAERRARVAEMVRLIEAQAVAARAKTGRAPLGREKVLRQNPHDAPRSIARSPAPLVHASTRVLRREYWGKYLAFVTAFHAAAVRLKEGILEAVHEFPPGCFLPRFPFRPPPIAATAPHDALVA